MIAKRKGVMIILDGLGDRGIPTFGGKTPLEAAHTPNMDQLAKAGQTGLIDPLSPGIPLGTHTATGLLFGLPLQEAINLTRGPIEAAGIGIANDPQAIYLRGNLATVEKTEKSYQIVDRRAGRIKERVDELLESIREIDLGNGMRASFYPATHHRIVLKLTGPDVTFKVTSTDPGNHFAGKGPLECRSKDPANQGAVHTAEAINKLMTLVIEKLADHPVNADRVKQGMLPANCVLLRSPGRIPHLHTQLHRLGMKTAVVAGEKTIIGLANMLGYTTITKPSFTALPDTDVNEKVLAAKAALQDHDMVYLHIKATDGCSHDFNPTGKRELLEHFDQALPMLMDSERVIAITGDHSTDSNTGRHCGDPVPSLLCGPLGRPDQTTSFGESAVSVQQTTSAMWQPPP